MKMVFLLNQNSSAGKEGTLASFRKLDVLQGHLSSVRAIAFSGHDRHNSSETDSNCREGLLFSGGGRAEIKAWKLFTRYSEWYFDFCGMLMLFQLLSC